jgi:hypothetical protein
LQDPHHNFQNLNVMYVKHQTLQVWDVNKDLCSKTAWLLLVSGTNKSFSKDNASIVHHARQQTSPELNVSTRKTMLIAWTQLQHSAVLTKLRISILVSVNNAAGECSQMHGECPVLLFNLQLIHHPFHQQLK